MTELSTSSQIFLSVINKSAILSFSFLLIILFFFFLVISEPTQCITLFSRQGTNDTIDEVEDDGGEQEQEQEQEHSEPVEKTEEEPEGAASSLCAGEEGVEPDVEREEAQETQWEGAEAGETTQPSGTEEEIQEYAGGRDEGESSGPEYLHTDGREGLFTPDTDAPNTSDADVPPSYSKAVSFDRLSISTDGSDDDRRLMVMTPDSRSEDSLLPSMTTELTASELLLNK